MVVKLRTAGSPGEWVVRGSTTKGHKGNFWSDGNVLYLDWGGRQLPKIIKLHT